MITIIDGDLFTSKAEFIVHQVNCAGVMRSGVAAQVSELYPHVETEYRKYLRYCKKQKINPLSTVQFVPVDEWALIMCETIKEIENVEAYDKKCQYIVNLFGQQNYGYDGSVYTNLNAMKKAFINIRDKAKRMNATVAMPWKIGSCRGGADWNQVYSMIEEVFDNQVDVELWRLNKR